MAVFRQSMSTTAHASLSPGLDGSAHNRHTKGSGHPRRGVTAFLRKPDDVLKLVETTTRVLVTGSKR
jgi:hypothetical protein